MRVLVVLCAAIACTLAKPAALSYAYSAIAPFAGYPYASAYSPFAYAGAPAVFPAASPAIFAKAAPVIAPYSAAIPATVAPGFAPFAPVAAGVKSQYHSQDELGQASYGHSEPGQAHSAIQDAAGNKVGSFSFINPEGKVVQTNYVADGAGYRVASNDLPIGPVVGPAPVADTPEVYAAKVAHFAEVAAAKARSKRAITPAATTPILAATAPIAYAAAPAPIAYTAAPAAFPYAGAYSYPYAFNYPHAYPTTNTIPVVVDPKNGFLADTPEVAAAKANHFAEHAAAAVRSSYYPYVF